MSLLILLFPLVMSVFGSPMPIFSGWHLMLPRFLRNRLYLSKTPKCLYRSPKRQVFVVFGIPITNQHAKNWHRLDWRLKNEKKIIRKSNALIYPNHQRWVIQYQVRGLPDERANEAFTLRKYLSDWSARFKTDFHQ